MGLADNDVLVRAIAIQTNWKSLKVTIDSEEDEVRGKIARLAQLAEWANDLSDAELRAAYREVLGWAMQSHEDRKASLELAARARDVVLPNLPPE